MSSSPDGRVLAGGQTLLPLLRYGNDRPSDIVQISGLVPKGISPTEGGLEIGAGSTHAEIAGSDVLRAKFPALATLAAGVGDVQVRNRGTIGGALAAKDPAGEYACALLAHDALITTDRRTISADRFLSPDHDTVLEPSEIILKVEFQTAEWAAYHKFLDPAAQWPMAGVYVSRIAESWRVAVTAVHQQGPYREVLAEQALQAWDRTGPIPTIGFDTRMFRNTPMADPEYRANLVQVLLRHCLEELED